MSIKPIFLRLCSLAALLVAALCACMPGLTDPPDEAFEGEMDAALAAAMNDTPFYMPPVTAGESKPSHETQLEPDDRILGVVIAGQPRAYSLGRLSGIADHVICDTFDDKRIAVTWCDRTECARVFALPAENTISIAGFLQGEMQVLHNGQQYPQSSALIPLDEVNCSIMTWKEWYTLHNDTQVIEQESQQDANQPETTLRRVI